ncbi:MAG TPA: chorismate mutase [Candidatus Paceibacterota bacterium]
MAKKQNKLGALRKKIETADREILKLLAKRSSIVRQIAVYKQDNDLAAVDAKRKKQLRNYWISEGKKLKLSSKIVGDIFDRIHSYSVTIENNHL